MNNRALPLLPTSLVGSYPQPDWLIDRERLRARFPPRVRARELWRVSPEFLEEAQDDATLLAIRDQERAGLVSAASRPDSNAPSSFDELMNTRLTAETRPRRASGVRS